ncbi:DnaB-like helicase C-terminal domain-containing protein [Bacillus cereus]
MLQMNKYGYGGPEEALYLQAYNLAESGHPTLLFSFESARIKLMKILMSHKLEINIDELDLSDNNTVSKFEKIMKELPAQLKYVDEVNLSAKEICNEISKNKTAYKITHVVFDRLNSKDINAIEQFASNLGIKIKY